MMQHFLAKYRIPLLSPEGPSAGGVPDAGASTSQPSASSTPSASPSPPSTSGPAGPPSTAPSSPSSAPAEAAPTIESQDFSFIFNDGEGDETTGTSPSGSPPAATTPAAQPSQPPAGAEPPKTAEPAAPTTPAAPTAPSPSEPTSTATATQPPILDPTDPTSLFTALVQHEAETIQHVADNLFKLSNEEVEALESDTVGTIPKLLAKAYVKMQQASLQQFARMLPAMLQRQTAMFKRNEANEAKFFSRWKDLKPEEHGDIVRQYAAVYRQMNPQATFDDMIEALGPMVMMKAKVVPSVVAPGAPASPMAPNGSRPPQPAPFVPAGPAAAGAAASTVTELSPWEAMMQDPDSE